MIPAREALQRLREGNLRFVSGTRNQNIPSVHSRRAELVEKQEPFAIIVSCSDSLVPPEIVFDQGLGDLFVVRTAGNIAEATQCGSVEFAAVRFRTRLVVVLGHSQCGAVLAALKELEEATDMHSGNLRSVLEPVRKSVEPLLKAGVTHDGEALAGQAVRANVDAAVKRLRCSEALARLIDGDGLRVVGAEYSLEAGIVTFLDDL